MNGAKEQVFNAKWHKAIFPFRVRRKWLKNLFFFFCFPFFLFVMMLRTICRRKLLPSSSYRRREVRTTSEMFAQRWLKEKEFSLGKTFIPHPIRLHTPDGACLFGVHYVHVKEKKDTPIILLFPGNSSLVKHGEYEWLFHSCQKLGLIASFISIDYRGCGESLGKAYCGSDLLLDGDTLYQYAKDFLEKKDALISFYGHGLGASIGACVKALYKKNRVTYVSERSFSSVTKLFSVRYPCFGPFFSWIIRRLGWEWNVTEKWPTLRGKKMVIFQKKDEVIPFAASLYESLRKNYPKEKVAHIELLLENPEKHRKFHHSLALNKHLDKKTGQCAEETVLRFLFSN